MSPGAEPVEAVGIIPANATVKTWEDSTLIGLPDGAILTLLHNFPVHDSEGEILSVVKQPIAYYRLQAQSLPGLARLFIRQTLLWAAQNDPDALGDAREALHEFITEAEVEYASAQEDEPEQEGHSDGDSS